MGEAGVNGGAVAYGKRVLPPRQTTCRVRAEARCIASVAKRAIRSGRGALSSTRMIDNLLPRSPLLLAPPGTADGVALPLDVGLAEIRVGEP